MLLFGEIPLVLLFPTPPDIFLIWDFLMPALADDFPLKSKWLHVCSSHQDSTSYSGRSQWNCSLDGLPSHSRFQVLQSLHQSFGDCAKRPNYNCYHRHFNIPYFFSFLARFKYLSLFSPSFSFNRSSAEARKSTIRQVLLLLFFFFIDNCKVWSSDQD